MLNASTGTTLDTARRDIGKFQKQMRTLRCPLNLSQRQVRREAAKAKEAARAALSSVALTSATAATADAVASTGAPLATAAPATAATAATATQPRKLGCSRCRYSSRGCTRCVRPNFRPSCGEGAHNRKLGPYRDEQHGANSHAGYAGRRPKFDMEKELTIAAVADLITMYATTNNFFVPSTVSKGDCAAVPASTAPAADAMAAAEAPQPSHDRVSSGAETRASLMSLLGWIEGEPTASLEHPEIELPQIEDCFAPPPKGEGEAKGEAKGKAKGEVKGEGEEESAIAVAAPTPRTNVVGDSSYELWVRDWFLEHLSLKSTEQWPERVRACFRRRDAAADTQARRTLHDSPLPLIWGSPALDAALAAAVLPVDAKAMLPNDGSGVKRWASKHSVARLVRVLKREQTGQGLPLVKASTKGCAAAAGAAEAKKDAKKVAVKPPSPPPYDWAQCEHDACGRWRRLPGGYDAAKVPEHFYCSTRGIEWCAAAGAIRAQPGQRRCCAVEQEPWDAAAEVITKLELEELTPEHLIAGAKLDVWCVGVTRSSSALPPFFCSPTRVSLTFSRNHHAHPLAPVSCAHDTGAYATWCGTPLL